MWSVLVSYVYVCVYIYNNSHRIFSHSCSVNICSYFVPYISHHITHKQFITLIIVKYGVISLVG